MYSCIAMDVLYVLIVVLLFYSGNHSIDQNYRKIGSKLLYGDISSDV